MESIAELLKKVYLFKEMTNEELRPIMDLAIRRNYREKSMVFMQEEPLDRVFFIASGKVKIYRTDVSGKEQIISILQKGDMFPHIGFFRRGTYPAHAEVVESATLLVIQIDDFEEMLINNPKIAIKLFRVMGERIIDLQNRLEEKILHDTYEQILMLLIRLGKTYGTQKIGNLTKLNTRFTNRELANMIGTTRETINRTLQQLRKKNLLDFHADGTIMLDIAKLEDECDLAQS